MQTAGGLGGSDGLSDETWSRWRVNVCVQHQRAREGHTHLCNVSPTMYLLWPAEPCFKGFIETCNCTGKSICEASVLKQSGCLVWRPWFVRLNLWGSFISSHRLQEQISRLLEVAQSFLPSVSYQGSEVMWSGSSHTKLWIWFGFRKTAKNSPFQTCICLFSCFALMLCCEELWYLSWEVL